MQTFEQTCEKLKIDVNQRDQQILVLEDSRKIDNVDVEELKDQISNVSLLELLFFRAKSSLDIDYMQSDLENKEVQ